MSGLRLSLLEFTVAGSRSGPGQALATLRRVTQLAEELGLHRVWITEHHERETIAQHPELFLPLLASDTRRIRIGVAGILLRYRSPFAVAEAFATLSASFPDRFDLGLARGEVDPTYAVALLDGEYPDKAELRSPYAIKAARLVALLGSTGVSLVPLPHEPRGLQVWILGSGSTSHRLAKDLGVAYCHANFLRVSQEVRADTIAVAGICTPDDERAETVQRQTPPAIKCDVVGGPECCARRIREIASASGATEVVFADVSVEPAEHLRSIELLATTLDVLRIHDRRE